jgi:hypothetical protein
LGKLQIKFRPSSHSVDLTIVATFNNETEAKKVAIKRATLPCRTVDNHLVVTISEATDYEAGKLRKQLREDGASKTRTYNNQDYQEAAVSIRVPLGITENTLPLMLNHEEINALKALETCCGNPQVAIDGNEQVWTFKYMGEERFGDKNMSWVHEPYLLPKGKATRFRDRVRLSPRFKMTLYGLEWRRSKDETTDEE